jgi:ribulose-5-phosphate 4-epimerase/fuculose-1-phosphate aldolase
VHNHPRFATLLASHAIVPSVFTQTGLILEGEIRLVPDYTGAISTKEEGRRLADQVPNGTAFLLANHGAITLGESVPHAVFKAVVLELICRQEYDSRVMSGPGHFLPIPEMHKHALKKVQLDISVKAYWEGAVRLILEESPEALN